MRKVMIRHILLLPFYKFIVRRKIRTRIRDGETVEEILADVSERHLESDQTYEDQLITKKFLEEFKYELNKVVTKIAPEKALDEDLLQTAANWLMIVTPKTKEEGQQIFLNRATAMFDKVWTEIKNKK
jgi:hypothetical protein